MALLGSMSTEIIDVDITTCNAAISACEKGRGKEGCIGILRQRGNGEDRHSTITCSAAVSACEKGGMWEEALALLSSMATERIDMDAIT